MATATPPGPAVNQAARVRRRRTRMAFDELRRRPMDPVRFGDVPMPLRLQVEITWRRLLDRWGRRGRLPGWRKGLLAAVARSVVLSPLTTQRAHRLLAQRGGL